MRKPNTITEKMALIQKLRDEVEGELVPIIAKAVRDAIKDEMRPGGLIDGGQR